MTIKRVDNREQYFNNYWQLYTTINKDLINTNPDLLAINSNVALRSVYTYSGQFVYGYDSPAIAHAASMKHNIQLTTIQQKCAMLTHTLVKQYKLRHLKAIKIGINYTLIIGKYTIRFIDIDSITTAGIYWNSVDLHFDDLTELGDKIKQYCSQMELRKLLLPGY